MNDTNHTPKSKQKSESGQKSEPKLKPELKSKFLQIIMERGYFHQATNLQGLDDVLVKHDETQQLFVAYIGFDCTAPSLHVGSLMQIMILRWLQKCGHKPIILLGGFTTKIGDPSGKDKSRPPITDAQIAINKEGIAKVFKQFLHFGDGATDAIIVDNNDWLSELSFEYFLTEISTRFSVNQMIKMDSVRLRLEREQEMSMLEFSYMVIQAYDFVELFNHFNCRLQIGGSDQWGNIIQGIDLNRRLKAKDFELYRKEIIGKGKTKEQAETLQKQLQIEWDMLHNIFGLTTPLLATSSGAKMGKTADGAVWLNGDMLSSDEYYQFWRNCDDADVGRFLKLFTDIPLWEIEVLEQLQGASINEAKKYLAYEATRILHGQQAADDAKEAARKTFEEGAISSKLSNIALNATKPEITAFQLFHLSGLCASGSDARKLIQGGGAKINDVKVISETQIINLHDYVDAPLKLSSGKKKHILIKFE